MVDELFLRSFMLSGTVILGIVVLNSCFQSLGHTFVLVISLYILQSGIASRSPYLDIRAGKMSPLTIDLGFLKALITGATLAGLVSW